MNCAEVHYFLCDYMGYVYPLEAFGKKITVGRNINNIIRIHEIQTSRFHAHIEIESDKNSVTVKDLNTDNGTFVFNDKILSGRKVGLKVGDLIGFGGPAKMDAPYTFRLQKMIPDLKSILNNRREADLSIIINEISENSEFKRNSADEEDIKVKTDSAQEMQSALRLQSKKQFKPFDDSRLSDIRKTTISVTPVPSYTSDNTVLDITNLDKTNKKRKLCSDTDKKKIRNKKLSRSKRTKINTKDDNEKETAVKRMKQTNSDHKIEIQNLMLNPNDEIGVQSKPSEIADDQIISKHTKTNTKDDNEKETAVKRMKQTNSDHIIEIQNSMINHNDEIAIQSKASKISDKIISKHTKINTKDDNEKETAIKRTKGSNSDHKMEIQNLMINPNNEIGIQSKEIPDDQIIDLKATIKNEINLVNDEIETVTSPIDNFDDYLQSDGMMNTTIKTELSYVTSQSFIDDSEIIDVDKSYIDRFMPSINGEIVEISSDDDDDFLKLQKDNSLKEKCIIFENENDFLNSDYIFRQSRPRWQKFSFESDDDDDNESEKELVKTKNNYDLMLPKIIIPKLHIADIEKIDQKKIKNDFVSEKAISVKQSVNKSDSNVQKIIPTDSRTFDNKQIPSNKELISPPVVIEKSKIKATEKNRGDFLLKIPEVTAHPKNIKAAHHVVRKISNSQIKSDELIINKGNPVKFDKPVEKNGKESGSKNKIDLKNDLFKTDKIITAQHPKNIDVAQHIVRKNLKSSIEADEPVKTNKGHSVKHDKPPQKNDKENKIDKKFSEYRKIMSNYISVNEKSENAMNKKPKEKKRVVFSDLDSEFNIPEIIKYPERRNTFLWENFADLRPKFYSEMVSKLSNQIEFAIMKICKWNVNWLEEQKERQHPPTVYKLKNINDITQRVMSHLFSQLWRMLSKSWNESNDNNFPCTQYMEDCSYMQFLIIEEVIQEPLVMNDRRKHIPNLPSTFSCSNLWTVKAYRVLSETEEYSTRAIRKGQLVILNLEIKGAKLDGKSRTMVFAYIWNETFSPISQNTEKSLDLTICNGQPREIQRLFLKVPPRSFNLIPGSKVKIRGLILVDNFLRPFMAFPMTQYCPISKALTSPDTYDFSLCKTREMDQSLDKYLVDSQRLAVTTCLDICTSEKPNICIIDGPAGSGKTQVIVSYIRLLFYKKLRNLNGERIRILVVSNADAESIDLATMLQRTAKKLPDDMNFNVVHYGHSTLDCNLEKLVQNMIQNNIEELISIPEEINLIKARINSLELGLNEKTKSNKNAASTLRKNQNELEDLRKELTLLNNGQMSQRLHNMIRELAQKKILNNADVVVTKFNSCWSSESEHFFIPSKSNLGDVTRFTVCIFENAADNTDMWYLIPFIFRIRHLILIGDIQPVLLKQKYEFVPELKEAPVVCMYQKLMNCKSVNPPIVVRMDCQFSSHPGIFSWPRSTFYNGLQCGSKCNMNEMGRFDRLKPYVLIDHLYPFEKYGSQVYNENEAELISKMLDLVCLSFRKTRLTIGIISPIGSQCDAFRPKIAKCKEQYRNSVIMVDVLEGFCGRFYDVIFVSLTHINGVTNNPTWLCNALTRAKRSLIICGNFESVEQTPLLEQLLGNAKNRNLRVEVTNDPNYLTDEYLRSLIFDSSK